MKKIRKILSGILSAAMLFAAAAPASAAVNDTGFTDVAAGAWYADAVQYARETGLMSGRRQQRLCTERYHEPCDAPLRPAP